MQERLLFAVDPVILTNILLETPCSQVLLFFGEPWGCTREVGQDPDRNESDDNGDGAFDDEQPTPKIVRLQSKWNLFAKLLPGTESLNIVHVTSNSGSDQARKGTRQERSRVQSCSAESKLLASIPCTEEVQATGL